MNKELEALENIKDFYPQWRLSNRNDFEIIETALKRLEEIETKTHSVLREDISKQLKALEIIKEIDKNALLQFISVCVKDQDKYDFLKEVLL